MKKRTEFVNFEHDVDVTLPHPEQMAICKFLGRAKITIEIDGDEEAGESREYRAIEIVELFLAVDPPTTFRPTDFTKVSVPNYGKFAGIAGYYPAGWSKLLPGLEQAAFDQYDYILHAVTLPSEVKEIDPVSLQNLSPSNIFNHG